MVDRIGALLGMAISLAGVPSVAICSPFIAVVDDHNGLPLVSRGGAPAVSGSFSFWGGKWVWKGAPVSFRVTSPFEYSASARNPAPELQIASRIHKASTNRLTWEFDVDATRAMTAIGGGIEFTFDTAKFGAELGSPKLLPENRGWYWGSPGGTHVEMRFDPPVTDATFSSDDPTTIRVLFFRGEIPDQERRYSASLVVSDDIRIDPTSGEQFGLDDPMSWPADIVDWKSAPVDLSFLNAGEKPAGKHGFLQTKKGEFVFEDGTPVRFWGTNVTANALFSTDRENIKLQAKRLSELGFNLVRIHHHDSYWVNPNIFGDENLLTSTRTLNAASLEKLDWWIACLKNEGIYVWLDLHVQRHARAADGIEDFTEISKGKSTGEFIGFNYVNDSIRQAMQAFNEAYLNHLNEYTGLRYKDDPAVVALLLTNENDLTYRYGNALLPNRNVPHHTARYMAEAKSFAQKSGLPFDRVWRAWENGPSRIFLNDLERRFDAAMIEHLRGMEVRAPIATTSSWGNAPMSSLPALTAGNMIDVHAYGIAGEIGKNPVYAPNSLDWMAAAHVVDYPLTVTEWNVVPFPVADRHIMPIYVAGSASLQGWNAMMQYAYAVRALVDPGIPSNWYSFNDPALLATLPAAALLFRRHDVRESKKLYVFAPSERQLFDQTISPATSVALRTAAEAGKLMVAMPHVPELPWLQASEIPKGATVITDPDQVLIDKNASGGTSDTGEVRRNWDEGTYTIDTSRTQAAAGWIGSKNMDLSDVTISVTTRNATVVVQSLTDAPIADSDKMLISLGARSVPRSATQLPFYSEPVVGHISVRGKQGLKLFSRQAGSGYERELPFTYNSGRYEISLPRDLRTYWLVLR